jgi:nicotinamide phosphoribosyltransferase
MGTFLKDEILNSGGRMIMRPDSGNPTTKPAEIGNILVYRFGATENVQGFMVLHPSVGVIQGDGLTVSTMQSIIDGWVNGGFSLDNFALGMGSGISHDGRRDDFSFSVKAIAKFNSSDNKWTPLLKNPKTDSGKKSLSGLVRCYENENGELYVEDVINNFEKLFEETNGWKIWYINGERYNFQSFTQVREFARKGLII